MNLLACTFLPQNLSTKYPCKGCVDLVKLGQNIYLGIYVSHDPQVIKLKQFWTLNQFQSALNDLNIFSTLINYHSVKGNPLQFIHITFSVLKNPSNS